MTEDLTPSGANRDAWRLHGRVGGFMNTIKGKIFLIFAATFVSVCALMLLNLLSLSTVKERLLLSERYDDLLNNILEVRRFEKNYLFSHDAAALEEGLSYLDRAGELLHDLAADVIRVSDRATYARFTTSMDGYRTALEAFRDGAQGVGETDIRARGKALLGQAESLRRIKRARIHATIVRTQWLPFAFLGVFVLLMVLVIQLIGKGLLRPLDLVRHTTSRVARGDFSPIPVEMDRHLGEISGLIVAFNHMAQELEINQENLLQARKIAALGTFTAGIAHELNNPINNISLTAEALLEGADESADPEDLEMLREIMAQSDRAGDIVRNLLDFSRTESPSFSPIRPADVVGSTVSLIRNQVLLAGIRLEIDVPADLPLVMGNLRNLQQVFMNLLLNAIQATPRDGLIRVAGSDESGEGFVRMEVSDTGTGIPDHIMEHIFEPFYTTKDVGRGTGLGLSVTYAIVKRHNGRIDVHSDPGHGTVFTVRLPKAPQGPDNEEQERD